MIKTVGSFLLITVLTFILQAPAYGNEEFTDEEQYLLGRLISAYVLTDFKLHTPGKEQSYLSNIGQVLALASDWPEIYRGYHFILLDEPERAESFALPGGFIFVTSGLISRLKNEDELAGLIAHEVGHIIKNHPVNSVNKNDRKRLKEEILFLSKEQVQNMPDEEFQKIVSWVEAFSYNFIDKARKRYGLEKEKKADNEALNLMRIAGYFPEAIISAIETLESERPGKHGNSSERVRQIKDAVHRLKSLPPLVPARTERFNRIVGSKTKPSKNSNSQSDFISMD